MQKDQRMNIDEARDKLKLAGVPEDEMAALERQLAPGANAVNKESKGSVGFVSAGVEPQSNGGMKVSANKEDIELPEEGDSEDEERVEIAQKGVPSAVFGGLARKREEMEKDGPGDNSTPSEDNGDSRLGALERIKRQRQAVNLNLSS